MATCGRRQAVRTFATCGSLFNAFASLTRVTEGTGIRGRRQAAGVAGAAGGGRQTTARRQETTTRGPTTDDPPSPVGIELRPTKHRAADATRLSTAMPSAKGRDAVSQRQRK